MLSLQWMPETKGSTEAYICYLHSYLSTFSLDAILSFFIKSGSLMFPCKGSTLQLLLSISELLASSLLYVGVILK